MRRATHVARCVQRVRLSRGINIFIIILYISIYTQTIGAHIFPHWIFGVVAPSVTAFLMQMRMENINCAHNLYIYVVDLYLASRGENWFIGNLRIKLARMCGVKILVFYLNYYYMKNSAVEYTWRFEMKLIFTKTKTKNVMQTTPLTFRSWWWSSRCPVRGTCPTVPSSPGGTGRAAVRRNCTIL